MKNGKYIIIFVSAVLLSLYINFDSFGQEIRESVSEQDEYVSNEILVKFKDNVPENERERIYKELKVIRVRNGYGDHYHVLTIEEGKVSEMLEKCSKYAEIEYAEPNHIYRANLVPDDEFFSFQWHMPLIHIEEAWEVSTGWGVTVAVVDTGVNPEGIDGFGSRLILGRDFIRRNREVQAVDDNGHGTHVAGTIAQETNNGIGVSGVAFNATILAVKALNEHGSGSSDAVADGIRWATNHGAQVINLSLGGPNLSETQQRAVNFAIKMGVVVVTSAGNGGTSVVSFPAAFEGVISVGAITLDKAMASYSNHGPDLDIVAPGGLISKDQNNDNNSDGVLQESLFTDLLKSPEPIWNYYLLQGTSFSAPHVSGVVALLLSKNPDLTPDEVRDILINTAEDLGEPGRDDEFGWGLVNAAGAVSFQK